MFGEHFQLNPQTLSAIEEIGRHMPGGFFIYKADASEDKAGNDIKALVHGQSRKLDEIAVQLDCILKQNSDERKSE